MRGGDSRGTSHRPWNGRAPMDCCPAATARLRRRSNVRCLRTMAFAPYADVPAALGTPGFAAPLPDETAMVLFDGRTTLRLNLVAAFVWDLLDGTRSLDDATRTVLAAFGVDPPTGREDVRRLCEDFRRAGLIEVIPDDAQARVADGSYQP